MPVTKVQKITRVIIMLIKRINASPRGFMDAAKAGLTYPRIMASTTATTT
jgi:hypothetical protein